MADFKNDPNQLNKNKQNQGQSGVANKPAVRQPQTDIDEDAPPRADNTDEERNSSDKMKR